MKIEPRKYSKLSWQERKRLRNEYVKAQNRLCYYCNSSLDEPPPDGITNKPIDITLYPQGFLDSPIHLQHCHVTDRTEGAVHAYCNAILFEYHRR